MVTLSVKSCSDSVKYESSYSYIVDYASYQCDGTDGYNVVYYDDEYCTEVSDDQPDTTTTTTCTDCSDDLCSVYVEIECNEYMTTTMEPPITTMTQQSKSDRVITLKFAAIFCLLFALINIA